MAISPAANILTGGFLKNFFSGGPLDTSRQQPFSEVAGPRSLALLAGATPYAASPANVPDVAGQMRAEIANRDLINALNAARNPRPAPPPTLPNFSIADTFNRAREIATSAVSPYYEKQFQLFKEGLERTKARGAEDVSRITSQATEDFQSAIQELQQENAITKQRTTEDVSRNIGQIGENVQDFQENSAAAFKNVFNNVRNELSKRGLTFSGIGQGQQTEAIQGKRREEAQTVRKAEQQKAQQRQLQTRTFEDLARGEVQATARGEKIKGRTIAAAQTDYNRLTEDLIAQEVSKSREIEFQKEQAIDEQTGGAAKNLFNQYLSGLAKPEQVSYASNLYGGFF